MSITKRIPIAIGIKPNQEVEFTNKTIDGNKNTIQNIPTSALQFNTISINGSTIPLGGSINIQAGGGDAIIDTNTTYSIKASSISGGANLDLDAGGSGAGTESIKFEGGGNVTVSRVNANTIRISDAGTLGGVALTSSNSATLTNKTISGTNNTLSDIPNSALVNNSITINDIVVPLGGSIEVEGSGGGAGDVTTNGTQTLTNKTISGINNTLLSIPSSALQTPYISINGERVDLGTNFTVDGLGNVTTTGTQDLSNKSLLAPILSNPKIIGGLTVGSGSGTTGSAGQVLKSTGSGVQWANENQVTATSLTIGSGLSGAGGTEFNGSNAITVSINTSVVATLSGAQTLQSKTLVTPTLKDSLDNDITLPTSSANDVLVTELASQTLSNKTLDNASLTGLLTAGGSSGSPGQALIVNPAGDGLTWGAVSSGGGGSGDLVGPATSTDNGIARFDALTGKILQDSQVTIADDGAITAPAAASVIPFYHMNQSTFPSATEYHGAIAHSHVDGAMFFAHAGNWIQMANAADVTVSTRQSFSTGNFSLTSNATTTQDLTGAYKSYLLFKIQTSHAAWVRVYTSIAARNADTNRSIDQDPLPGSGVIAEVITTGASTQVLTPAVIGFNDEATPVGTIYLSITNRSGANQSAFNVSVTALKLEA